MMNDGAAYLVIRKLSRLEALCLHSYWGEIVELHVIAILNVNLTALQFCRRLNVSMLDFVLLGLMVDSVLSYFLVLS